MFFEKILIIGGGNIALEILKILLDKKPSLEVISYKPHALCMIKQFCQKHYIPYHAYDCPTKITQFLSNISEKTLIISANNNYIFPQDILSKPYFKIINFHNALLPLHKGVNAPIWSIYNQDKLAGITWHIATNTLDSGDIIIQKQISLTPEMTSLRLIKILMELGVEAFREIRENLLNNTLISSPMPHLPFQMHTSKQLPNNGILDIHWERPKISAFLRSMDANGVIPKPKIFLSHRQYIIESYSINAPFSESPSLFLCKDNIYMLLKQQWGGGARET
ncbi:formyltransferase family protein [Helicobacter sp. 11S03491-1]|uniref:formyltransferase family protein n=1 Tax=Helicobacter sp. 11S03491-1 TaxID=1476196 RepID=UPI000BCFA705|nr:formyltransferase family protein [Helicobacter sp. 11S03491-1]PAF43780.1 hypothetical protein BKH45_00495 [Helicobacter sp. 11S03491-1]